MKNDNTKPPPVLRKRSERITVKTTAPSDNVKTTTESLFNTAKDKAYTAIHTTRSWFTPSTESFTQLESLSTVMFSPLAAHPVYRSETMVKAIKLMQQQQQRQTSSNNALISPPHDLVLQGKVYSWPSSAVLLQAEIPDQSSLVSLFQGFASTYPSLTPKRSRQRKKKQSGEKLIRDHKNTPRSLENIISEREKKVRDCDKISMQKSSTANEIDQINLQINDLLNKRKTLEQKWHKLEEKDLHLQLVIEDLNDTILDIEEGVSSTSSSSTKQTRYDEYNDDYEMGVCFKSFEGHMDDITCLDFNHPKGILVSASLDGEVRAWDLYRNQYLGNIEGHVLPVRCLQLNEARLLTGSNDGTIKQWDLSLIPNEPFNDTSIVKETFTLKGHQSGVTTFDADQHTLVSGSNDKTIRQWDLETQQCILSLDVLWEFNQKSNVDAVNDFVGALQFWDFALATGTSDGKIRMWDMRTGQVQRKLPGHNGPITCLQFDEVHLISGSLDNTIKIWDLRTGSVFDTLTFNSPVASLQFDARKVVSSNATNIIDVYNRTSFQHTQLYGHKGGVNTVKFHHGVLASGGSDCVVKLWSI